MPRMVSFGPTMLLRTKTSVESKVVEALFNSFRAEVTAALSNYFHKIVDRRGDIKHNTQGESPHFLGKYNTQHQLKLTDLVVGDGGRNQIVDTLHGIASVYGDFLLQCEKRKSHKGRT